MPQDMLTILRKLCFPNALILSAVVGVTLSAPLARAHNEGPEMDDFSLDAGLEVLQRAAELAPRFVEDDDGVERPEIVPTMKIGGKKVYINSYMQELVKEYVRFYYAELERDMPRCQVVPLGEILTEVDEMVADGFITQKILQPLGTAVSHITLSSADLGGRYGNIAFGAKIAAEIGEGVLSKAVGGGGVHIFCSAIDAVIVFESGTLQTLHRDFSYSREMDLSATRTLIYRGAVSMSLRHAQQRIAFEVEPFSIDEHELEEVDEEGPQRRRWWGLVKGGKREAYILKMAKRAEVIGRQNKTLGENELSQLARLGSKQFLGLRKGYTFWTFSRKGSANYMSGKALMDKALGQKATLWILSAQENVFRRSLLKREGSVAEAVDIVAKSKAGLPTYGPDEVREGLASEYAPNDVVKAADFNKLLMDIERIFDPNQDVRLRQAQILMLQSVLSGFFYDLLTEQLPALYPKTGNWFYRQWKDFWIHIGASKYAFYANQYANYMSVVAFRDDPELLLSRKYEAMETLLRIFRHLKLIVPRAGVTTNDWLATVEDANKRLKAFTPWQEKRGHYSWVPILPFRESYAHWTYFPDAENLWGIVPKLPARAPLCVDMDIRKEVH